MLTLYTFWVSHFSEKARWALDRAGVAYREQCLSPGLHILTTRRLASRTTVPLLRQRGRVIQGSSDIIDYVEEVLAPQSALASGQTDRERAEDRALERELDTALGRTTQRLVYAAGASAPDYWRELWSAGSPPWVARFYRLTLPWLSKQVHRMYRSLDPQAVAQASATLAATADRLDALLLERPYLAGDRPGRADYATAAFLAPVVQPPEHPCPWPAAPAVIREPFSALEDRPIAEHVRRMYREHRGRASLS